MLWHIGRTEQKVLEEYMEFLATAKAMAFKDWIWGKIVEPCSLVALPALCERIVHMLKLSCI